MEKQEIQTRVKSVVAKVLKISVDEIGDEANFVFDLGSDSMQSVQLVAAFDEEFNIEMEQDKALQIQTVSDAANFISQYLK
jgi:acyl carrier protein